MAALRLFARKRGLSKQPPYTHSRVGPNTIRLLLLHPGSNDDVLVGEIKQYQCIEGQIPSYEAVSYVWGDAKLVGRISIHDCWLGLTKNLELALKIVRLKDQNQLIWVDQVCVDQNNLEERSEQILLMNRIYANSERVLVSLGKYKSIDIAADLIRELLVIMDEGLDVQVDKLVAIEALRWKALAGLLQLPWVSSVSILCITNQPY
jgi:hypothetical protein